MRVSKSNDIYYTIKEIEDSLESTLDKTSKVNLYTAISLAKEYHKGQIDKGGQDYFNHLKSVALNVSNINECVVAILHDILEDTHCSVEVLEYYFPSPIVDAVISMTRGVNESYNSYIRRLGVNEIARRVKMSDLKNNMDLSRIKNPKEQDYKRCQKYRKTLLKLEKLEKNPLSEKR